MNWKSKRIVKPRVEISRILRRRDKTTGKFVYDIRFKTRAPISDRTLKVAEAFGLGIDEEKEHVIYEDFELRLGDRDIVYITGDSGSGKSVLLRALEEDLGDQAINIADVEIDPEKPLIDTVGKTFQEALTLLSRVGLNDAFLFLRPFNQLSDGQKYRYKIARMIDSEKKYWIADEFCSTLDRITAKIVAFNLQKLARRIGRAAILATTHTDLEEDLASSIRIHKGWGREIHVDYRSNDLNKVCSVTQGIKIRESSMEDYKKLAYLHYRATDAKFPLKFYAMERNSELIGVINYKYPPILTAGRMKTVGRRVSVEELNRDWTIINRVIIHPKYRTIGLGARLVRETLPLVGRRYVELVAVMAQYNPFAEKAGMRKIQESKPHPKILEAVEKLRGLGFNPVMIASETYNLKKLKILSPEDVEKLRETLLDLPTNYYKRLRSGMKPYYKKSEFREWLWSRDLPRLAKCIHILSVLSETKVYLFWCRDWIEREGGGGVG